MRQPFATEFASRLSALPAVRARFRPEGFFRIAGVNFVNLTPGDRHADWPFPWTGT